MRIDIHDTHVHWPKSSYPRTMTHAVTITLSVTFLAFIAEEATCQLLANLHRRRVPEWAWKAASVDQLFWGFLGTNIYVPFSDLYYLVNVRSRLDRAEQSETRSPSP